jgi:hypothetical protein
MPVRNAHDHVQRVLSTVDPGTEVMATGQRFVAHPGGVAESLRGDLPAWCLDRVKRLTGATSFKVVTKNRDVRMLLAFGLLGLSQHPARRPARVSPSTPVPRQLARLEPDFFKVLLDAVRSNAKQSPSFRARMKAAEADVSNLLTRLAALVTSPAANRRARGGVSLRSRATAEEGLVLGLVVLIIWAVVAWVQDSVSKED